MTFVEMYGAQLDAQLGSSDRIQLFTTALRKDAINKGNSRFCLQTRCTEKILSFSVTSGVQEYDVDTSATGFVMPLSDPYIKIVHASYTQYLEGKDLIRRDQSRLSISDPGFRDTSRDGRPTHFYWRRGEGKRFIGFVPVPLLASGETWTGYVNSLIRPTVMSADADEPCSIAGEPLLAMEPYHMAIVHYAAALLEPLRKNYTQVKQQMQFYSGYVAEYLSSRTEEEELSIFYARDYLGESSGPNRPPDPRR